MKTNKKIKNLLCYIVAFMLAIVANAAFTKLNQPKFNVFAADNSSTLTVQNSGFSNKDSDDQPKYFTPTIENTSVDAKVVDITDKDIAIRFENIERTSVADNYVLMIDAGDKVCNYGYKTNSDIKLTKGGNYLIAVDVYTAEGGAAYLELEANNKVFDSISNVVSNEDWTTYYFFVKNNDVEDINVKLGLHLKNSSGVVMFDDVRASQINDNELNSYLDGSISSNRYSYLDKTADYVVNNKYTVHDINFIQKNYETGSANTTSGIVLDTDGEYTHAYKIVNSNKTYTTFETTQFSSADDYLEFAQNNIYKVSFNVKAEELNGKATIKLVQVVEDGKTGVDGSIDITSNTKAEGNISNDYKNYSFYIKSSPSEIAKYKLVVEFGTSSSKASGSIYISTIEVTNTTTAIYDSISSDSSCKQIDLTSTIASDSTILTNGKFDLVTVGNYTQQYPLTAPNWEVATGENTQAYGIINTNADEFAKISGYPHLKNPKDTRNNGTTANNNVLMLHNTEADTLSYTSSVKSSLEALSIHKFQALVQTHNGPVTLSLVTKKDGKEIVLCSKNVDTAEQWEKVELFVKVGYQAMDISLKVTLNSTSWATAFVDDVRMDYYPTPTEESFASADCKIDLTNIISENTFDIMFAGENNANIETKIVAIDETTLNSENFITTSAEKAILINAFSNDTFYKLTSNLGFKLSSGTRYKISIDVYTQHINSENEELEYEDLGASIKLSSFDETFTAVKSNGKWTTYTFYINPDATTTAYLEFMLGTEEAPVSGNLYLANIQFTKDVSETTFNAASENATTKILNKTTVQDTETDEETTTEDEEKTEINWFYFASSMIFALAIVICVVGVMLKKVKFKKPVKKTKNAYDRNRTVSKQYYTRKATSMREEKIRELEKDLETMHNERVKFEEDYKHGLTKLRQLKIKRANASEIKQLEKELKKNQHLSAGIGVTINKAKQELDYVKTDAYMQSLIKKLSSQSPEKVEENKE